MCRFWSTRVWVGVVLKKAVFILEVSEFGLVGRLLRVLGSWISWGDLGRLFLLVFCFIFGV